MFSFEQMRAFTAVSENLHFSRAAESLGVSQPTVSKEIRQLERSIGAELFLRSAGGTRLSPVGEALQEHAKRVLDSVRDFEIAAKQALAGVERRVRIAASPSIVNRLLPELLRRVEDEDLPVSIEANEVETGQVASTVDSGRADIGLGHFVGKPRLAERHLLGFDEIFILCHTSWAERIEGDSLAALKTLPLLLWPKEQNPEYHDFLVGACRDRGLDPLLLTGTTRISGSWSYFMEDARAFALAPRDFARVRARDPLTMVPLRPSVTVPLEAVVSNRGSQDVAAVFETLLSLVP